MTPHADVAVHCAEAILAARPLHLPPVFNRALGADFRALENATICSKLLRFRAIVTILMKPSPQQRIRARPTQSLKGSRCSWRRSCHDTSLSELWLSLLALSAAHRRLRDLAPERSASLKPRCIVPPRPRTSFQPRRKRSGRSSAGSRPRHPSGAPTPAPRRASMPFWRAPSGWMRGTTAPACSPSTRQSRFSTPDERDAITRHGAPSCALYLRCLAASCLQPA